MTYLNWLGARDLFCNKRLEGIIPQLNGASGKLTAKDIDASVTACIQKALNGAETDKNEITVKGRAKTVTRRIQQLAPVLERIYEYMPVVTAALPNNTGLYLSKKTVSEIVRTRRFDGKLAVLKEIIENIEYNPDFGSGSGSAAYIERQEAWKKKVGYKE